MVTSLNAALPYLSLCYLHTLCTFHALLCVGIWMSAIIVPLISELSVVFSLYRNHMCGIYLHLFKNVLFDPTYLLLLSLLNPITISRFASDLDVSPPLQLFLLSSNQEEKLTTFQAAAMIMSL